VSPTLAHYAEYAAVRGAVGVLDALSWRRAGALGARLGALAYRPLGIRRGVVERQVAAAFPELGRDEVLRIARAAYAHLGRVSIEAALLPSLGPAGVLDLFEGVDGWQAVESAMDAGRGLIFVTGHLGNWELGGAYVAARGVPLDAIARRMANPLFDRYLTATRSRLGMVVVHDAEAVRRTPRALRDGRAIAFLADQGVLGLASTYVPFFGRPAKTPRGPAVFALRLKVPVVFAVALRQPSGLYRLIVEPVTVEETGDRERDIDAIVAAYTAALERWVRRAPEQYFWHHRRWRRQPPGTPPELREP
jgi:Kdo2-lipid IVA lauroyltransferase/acyltransferase